MGQCGKVGRGRTEGTEDKEVPTEEGRVKGCITTHVHKEKFGDGRAQRRRRRSHPAVRLEVRTEKRPIRDPVY